MGLRHFVLCAGLMLGSTQAFAQVDQSVAAAAPTPGGPAGVGTSPGFYAPYGQSFTPSLNGIDYAIFYVGSDTGITSTLSLSLFAGNSSFNPSNALATSSPVTIAPRPDDTPLEFDFQSIVALTSGNVYSLIINDLTPSSAKPLPYYGAHVESTVAAYSGGTLILSGVPNPTAQNIFSEGIRTTNGAVPEPATWAMVILGMGAIGFAMRRSLRASEVKFDAKRITEGALA